MDPEKLAGGCVLLIAFAVAFALLMAWPVMVLWGAVADDLGFQTIGLGTALQVSLLTSLLFKSVSSSSE